jgi:hypothetical protein
LENQNSAKDLQQSSVQKSNEYKLACTGTVYLKKSHVIQKADCHFQLSVKVFLSNISQLIQKADCHFQLSVKAIF